MSKPTFDRIEPLVLRWKATGDHVDVIFRCPVSGTEVASTGVAAEPAPAAVHHRVRRNLLTWLSGALKKTATADWLERRELADKAVQDAIVDAFRRVQSQFAWQQKERRFVNLAATGDLQTDFWRLVGAHPVTDPWDLIVLTRMIVTMAAANGTIDPAEREFFYAFTTPASGTLEELLKGPRMTTTDMLRTTPIVRDSLFAIAAVVACSDQRFELVEDHELLAYAAGLGIDRDRVDTLIRQAKEHIVDQAIEATYADGRSDPDEWRQVEDLAQQFDMGPEELLAVARRSRARRGIV
jgi:tellurite resistance protein